MNNGKIYMVSCKFSLKPIHWKQSQVFPDFYRLKCPGHVVREKMPINAIESMRKQNCHDHRVHLMEPTPLETHWLA